MRLFQACGRVLAHSVRNLADSLILPHDFEAYGRAMKAATNTGNYGAYIEKINSEIEKYQQNDLTMHKIDFNNMMETLRQSTIELDRKAKEWYRLFNDTGNTIMCNILYLFDFEFII